LLRLSHSALVSAGNWKGCSPRQLLPKYPGASPTDSTLDALHSHSGLEIESAWKDGRNWYALTLSCRLEQDEYH
jgi:hypothetical protein